MTGKEAFEEIKVEFEGIDAAEGFDYGIANLEYYDAIEKDLNELEVLRKNKEKEKFCYNVTPALGVPLLDWYLGCIKAFREELSKYEEVELNDDYNLMQLFESSSKSFPPQYVEDNLIESINKQLDLEYFNIKKYCSDLTFGRFLRDNKWLGERNIQNYLDDRRKCGANDE